MPAPVHWSTKMQQGKALACRNTVFHFWSEFEFGGDWGLFQSKKMSKGRGLMVVERWFVSGLGFWFVVELLLVILVAGNGRGVSTGASSSELCQILLLFSGGGWSGCYGKRVLEVVNRGFGWWR
ncbi:hypothetical protein H5410_003528 [Solanum commersonii]|uniref:Transmembrane protein n=1 Tax=Solanum commersonii TaxID=4109 RepID=A0A9J6B5C1_SOLCO|nr:hypothetical protein H5410_003528 [Solanum commersonii]